MLKWTRVFVTGLSLVLCAWACASSDRETVKVKEKDSGTTVSLHVGDILEVTLEGNPSTGYMWQRTAGGEDVLKQVGQPEIKYSDKNKRIVGAPADVCFRFEAVPRGNVTLKLAYLRPWEKDVKPAKTFEVPVEVIGRVQTAAPK